MEEIQQVKSQSLLVNKGLKNSGIKAILPRLKNLPPHFPVGLSIGKTNLPTIASLEEAIADITAAFRLAENTVIQIAYYELNISCPNLLGNTVDFYAPERLAELLWALDALKLSRPWFVKMPLNFSDAEQRALLRTISESQAHGVIYGNLQKDRSHPALDQAEVAKYPVGNFSGKPTAERSNQLIRLAYREFGSRLIIIGCGGVFSAEDAYRKIKLGASLVQLATGLVYRGPQLPGQINLGLIKLLQKDGYQNIAEAIGREA